MKGGLERASVLLARLCCIKLQAQTRPPGSPPAPPGAAPACGLPGLSSATAHGAGRRGGGAPGGVLHMPQWPVSGRGDMLVNQLWGKSQQTMAAVSQLKGRMEGRRAGARGRGS